MRKRIDELTRKDLLRDVDRVTIRRSKELPGRAKYAGIYPDYTINMQVDSSERKGKYTVLIQMMEYPDLEPLEDLTVDEKVRLAMDGDLRINCNCPAFCLRAGTKIKTLDGKNQTIEELLERYDSGESLWVYSVDKRGDFHPGKVSNVFISGRSSEFIRVHLDNGKVIETTPTHEFMMRDGTYKPAEELVTGMSLMPLYLQTPEDGYLRYHKNSGYEQDSRGWSTVYKQVAEDYFTKKDRQSVTERTGENHLAIHHEDYDKRNNSPENLRLMGWREHFTLHSKLLGYRLKNDPVFREKNLQGIRRHLKNLNECPTEALKRSRRLWSERGRKWCRENPEEHASRTKLGRNNMSPEDKALESQRKSASWTPEKREAAAREFSTTIKGYWDSLSLEERKSIGSKNYPHISNWEKNATSEEIQRVRLKRMRGRTRETILRMISQGIELTEENYKLHKKQRDPHVSKVFSSFEEMLSYHGVLTKTINHKVSKVERISSDSRELVYDITVEGYHNFMVGGVILHNCYWGFEYITTQLSANRGPDQERFPEIRNPKLIGVMCKHCHKAVKGFGSNWLAITNDIKKERYLK